MVAGGLFLRFYFWKVSHSPSNPTPAWLSPALTFVSLTPWVVLVILVALRLAGQRKARPVAFALGAVIPVAAAIGYVQFAPVVVDHLHREPFNAPAWRANANSDTLWPARLTMVDDLLSKDVLLGRTREDVIQLLGPPDGTSTQTLVYGLGPERGLIRIDSERLGIDFADGKVKSAAILRD